MVLLIFTMEYMMDTKGATHHLSRFQFPSVSIYLRNNT